MVGLFLFLEVEGSVTWLRLFAVSLPGFVLAVWNMGRSQDLRRSTIIAVCVVLGGIAAYQVVSKHVVSSTHAELPGGRFATTPQNYEELRILAAHAHPGEFFLQAGWPGDYIPLQVRNPLYVPTLGRWDGVSDQDIVLSVREMRSKRVPYVLWKRDMDEGCSSIDCNDSLSPFRTYLHSSYTPVETFQDGDVLWQKLDD